MSGLKLHLPANADHQEMYFDGSNLKVAFRDKQPQKKEFAVTGKVLRVVVFAYGRILEDRFFSAPSSITLGAGKKNTFMIPTASLPEGHTLLMYNENRSISVRLTQGITGILQNGDRLENVSSQTGKNLGESVITLPANSKGVLEIGNISIYFEENDDPERVLPVPFSKLISDPQFVRWLIASLAFHLLSIAVIALLPTPIPPPPSAEELAKTLDQQNQRFERLPLKVRQWKPASGPKANSAGGANPGRSSEGAKAPGQEGRAGKGQVSGGKGIKPYKQKDLNTVGVLPFLSEGRGAFSKLVGNSAGIDQAADTLGRDAARYGLPDSSGVREGKGTVGSGTGGGGKFASVGRNGLGEKGTGYGKRGNVGTGLAEMGTGRGATKVAVNSPSEDVYVGGSIPKEVIDRIIREHLGEIRYCYEREVQVKPDLRGKIITDFVIGLRGNVTSATTGKGSTMGDASTEQCVLRVIRRLEFPSPGAGTVRVLYPFLFRVAG